MKQYKIKDFTQHTDDPTSYDGTVVINGKELSVDIILEDEGETEKIEQQMNTFLSEINTLLLKAKECIAEKYLDLYNNNWRFGDDDEDDPDKPELTKKEFMEALSLRSLLFYSEDVDKTEEWLLAKLQELGYNSPSEVFLAEYESAQIKVIPYN